MDSDRKYQAKCVKSNHLSRPFCKSTITIDSANGIGNFGWFRPEDQRRNLEIKLTSRTHSSFVKGREGESIPEQIFQSIFGSAFPCGTCDFSNWRSVVNAIPVSLTTGYRLFSAIAAYPISVAHSSLRAPKEYHDVLSSSSRLAFLSSCPMSVPPLFQNTQFPYLRVIINTCSVV
ncbi:hypothetical protein EGR_11191 [Echinococcus granulosus]|uniref:Uncharacterized protein n=1 Tax=Echinococcus granulosus TaxID=6210 RepID=W6U6J0_ECHGR|nr:hypothetical protein EGR_11191 [Echinococcus granulosus]EUB53952.1 hypothetical protein EGR_11191 [Echinococcus granulosus]